MFKFIKNAYRSITMSDEEMAFCNNYVNFHCRMWGDQANSYAVGMELFDEAFAFIEECRKNGIKDPTPAYEQMMNERLNSPFGQMLERDLEEARKRAEEEGAVA